LTQPDDIYPPPSAPDQTPQINIMGGAGTFSAIGARLFSPPPRSKSVGWIIDAGTDFPDELRNLVSSWNTGVLIQPRNALTTRGWNGYGENDHRAFKYLTEKKRLTTDDLTVELLAAKSFHLICSAVRCGELVQRIKERRAEALGDNTPGPIIVWEPVPDLCTAEELENTKAALKCVDVLSPNHEELGALFSFEHEAGVDKEAVEKHSGELVASGIGAQGKGVIVVRSGKVGCYIARAGSEQTSSWLPAYHTDQSKVVDPTGGGNGFLGGLAVGLVRTEFNVIEAARWGSVAASFTIEQVGMPQLTPSAEDTTELWNGVSVKERLQDYKQRSELRR
jgi:sugar/nucleoside kinase (ribokinase family)